MKKTTLKYLAVAALAVVALAAQAFPEVAAGIQHAVAFVGPENLAALAFIGSTATTVVQGDTYTGKLPVNTQPRDSSIYEVAIPIKFPTAAPVANDLHLLCKLLPGVQVVDFTFISDDVDSAGPTASLSLGEANATLEDVTVVYKSGLTIGQTGGLYRFAAASAAADLRTIGDATKGNERVLALKWDTASTTYVADKTALLILKLVG